MNGPTFTRTRTRSRWPRHAYGHEKGPKGVVAQGAAQPIATTIVTRTASSPAPRTPTTHAGLSHNGSAASKCP